LPSAGISDKTFSLIGKALAASSGPGFGQSGSAERDRRSQ
jgi:hypothetical protein